jgi:hypothetical protein
MNNNPNIEESVSPARNGFWRQLTEVSSRLRWADILVFTLILAFGAWQFFCVARVSDFLYDDVFFADAARSLVQHGFYGINGYPETNMPPGTAWILGVLCNIGSCSHAVFLRTMVVFGTLGFMASYELLRRQSSRVVAAAICLLLISSRIHFELVTLSIWPCYPYFFTAMCALLVARKLEGATHLASRIGWGALLTAFIVASLMFASAGIAFLGAIVASVGVLFFRDRRLGFDRLRTYLAVLLLGIAVQGIWMHQSVEASAGIGAQEWPVAGFPHSYVAQLKLKEGRDPELGTATLRDLPVRVLKNAYEQANLLSRLLLQRSIYLAWMSIATVGMLLLVAIGWGDSIWRSRGGLQEWYFAGYEFIYLLWPWQLEHRFFLPVAPLASLYAWRGGKALVFLAKNKPRALGLAWFPVALLLAVNSWLWMHGVGHLPHAGLQDETSFLVWLLTAILAAWMIWANTSWLRGITPLRKYAGTIGGHELSLVRIAQIFGLVVVASLVYFGVKRQIAGGRSNLDPNSTVNRLTPDAEAGEWIRSNTATNAVVMARHVPTVYHYSNRNLLWFPPSSNPQLLMEGILRHRVNYVLVVRRQYNYYLPPDDDCFAPLFRAYPGAFRLVYQVPEFRVFQVVMNPSLPGRNGDRYLGSH